MFSTRRRFCLALTGLTGTWLTGCAGRQIRPGKTLQVLLSGGFAAAFARLGPAYEQRQAVVLRTQNGPSMGDTPIAIPARMARHEPADVIIMVREAFAPLIAAGLIAPDLTDLAQSRIALAVRASAPPPRIDTVETFRQTLLAAASVGVSDSASGVYISGELYARLGIVPQMAARSRTIPATPVGEIIAKGEVEIGMQQLSELLPVTDIRVVGLIPEALQKVTTYSAGIATYSSERTAAAELIGYLASPAARPAIEASGLTTLARHGAQ
jgi:molybdate transport system substrate-binding protein